MDCEIPVMDVIETIWKLWRTMTSGELPCIPNHVLSSTDGEAN